MPNLHLHAVTGRAGCLCNCPDCSVACCPGAEAEEDDLARSFAGSVTLTLRQDDEVTLSPEQVQGRSTSSQQAASLTRSWPCLCINASSAAWQQGRLRASEPVQLERDGLKPPLTVCSSRLFVWIAALMPARCNTTSRLQNVTPDWLSTLSGVCCFLLQEPDLVLSQSDCALTQQMAIWPGIQSELSTLSRLSRDYKLM